MRDLLTASRISCLQRCPRAHLYRYEIGLKPVTTAAALRFGSGWHTAMESRANGADCEGALAAAIADKATLDEMQVATLSGLLAGYYKHYAADAWLIKPEVEFSYPLRRGRGAMWASGKIDGISIDPNVGILIEHKTAGCDIAPDSDYWLRLRGNFQILMYVEGARHLGYDPNYVVYDVVRKPAIRQKQNETPEQFGDRLAADCMERPDFYFARREVPILEDDLERFRTERNQLASEIVWRRRRNAWPRAVSERTCQSCEFAGFCLQGTQASAETIPAGFEIKPIHEELTQEGT